ncbi:ribbon-helix-helix domain-containing protein [Aestuariibacter halophilus]|uniref:Ribbon-helix-helix domain-containing protein n=1 Tax=Fluctibacter halophilus TaxID=226011 RepID=A0ABS8GE56_9ALTE|nr:ribbon-helix-helix domain-containing protein [Aestuariibacter halophilus]MCC2618084.1 ribbon-helix-helix domain-containing protein [Aestuariibacter halophilus]
MTLASLKKCAPSVERAPRSVDEFIDEATLYARGLDKVVVLHETRAVQEQGPFKRATFTLSEQAIGALNDLSEKTGIAKSRLIRIWLMEQQRDQDLADYIDSAVK